MKIVTEIEDCPAIITHFANGLAHDLEDNGKSRPTALHPLLFMTIQHFNAVAAWYTFSTKITLAKD